MSVSVDYALKITTSEVPAASGGTVFANITGGAATIQSSSLSSTGTLDSTTTPAVTLSAEFSKAMTAGAATIDLTALTGTFGTVDLTGKRVILAKFRNPSTNANTITVTFGAANAYLLNGAAFKYILNPGDEIMCYLKTTSVTVDATHKNIDISGTGTQALDCGFVAG